MVILSEGCPPCSSPGNGRPVQVGFYEIIRTLGRGNFAVVKLARHKVTKTQVAIKIIDKTKLSQTDLDKIYREVQIMKLLKHPHIIKLYQVMETKDMLYMVLEYAKNGEMFDYLSCSGRLGEAEARRKFCQILSAVEYCHKNHIVHRDLKAENLLLDANMDVKLADFGFGNFYSEGEVLSTWCGSPPYAAPEVFEGKEYDGPPLDIWSLGVVLYVMVSGSLPFDAPTLPALRQRVVEGRFRIPFFMSQDCENLVRRMLSVDPTKRITVAQIKSHRWLQIDPSGALPDLQRTPSLTTSLTADGELCLGEYSEQVLGIMQTLGIDRRMTVESIQNNSYNHFSAIYCLLLERVSELQIRRLSQATEELGLAPGPARTTTTSEERLEDLGEEEAEEGEGEGRGMRQATLPSGSVTPPRRRTLAAVPGKLRRQSPCISGDSIDEGSSDSCLDSFSYHSSFSSSSSSSSSGSPTLSSPAQSPPLQLWSTAAASGASSPSESPLGLALPTALPVPPQDSLPVPNFEEGRRASDTSLSLDLRVFHHQLRKEARAKGLMELNKIRMNPPRSRQACPPGLSPLSGFIPARLPCFPSTPLPQESLYNRRVLQVPLQHFLSTSPSKPLPLLFIPPPPSVTAPTPPPLPLSNDLHCLHLPCHQYLPPSSQQNLPPLSQPYYQACSEQPLDLSLPTSSSSNSSSSAVLVASAAHLLETHLHIGPHPEDLTQPCCSLRPQSYPQPHVQCYESKPRPRVDPGHQSTQAQPLRHSHPQPTAPTGRRVPEYSP